MQSIKKHLTNITKILSDSKFNTKIKLYMSTRTYGDAYDPEENNYTNINLPPITIKAYCRDLTGETAFYKQYGIHYSGIKEILCDKKWKIPFEKCNKIEIEDIEYQTMKDANNRTSIIGRPFGLIRITVTRKG